MLSIVLGSRGMSEQNWTLCPCEASIYQNKILNLDLAFRKKKIKLTLDFKAEVQKPGFRSGWSWAIAVRCRIKSTKKIDSGLRNL